jgi:hypothetical protein
MYAYCFINKAATYFSSRHHAEENEALIEFFVYHIEASQGFTGRA